MHYNIAAVNVYTGRRFIIPFRSDLPREEVKREAEKMNADISSVYQYLVTTEEA